MKWLLPFISACALFAQTALSATLSVLTYGALGDCANITVSVTSNSAVMVTTNAFTSANIGQVVQLFQAGRKSILSSSGVFQGYYYGTPTNNQDMVATIVSISNGTNVTISLTCGVTTNNILCTYGHDNRTNFDNCIAAGQSNDVIYVPAGNFMLIPPTAIDTNYVPLNSSSAGQTLTLWKGGLTFLGDGTNNTILTGNGAWMQKGDKDWGYRGYFLQLSGPPTNNGPLIFNGIQFNGNAVEHHTTFNPTATLPTTGWCWDPSHVCVSHGALVNDYSYVGYTNCFFNHWHGETIQGVSVGNGILDVGNCKFYDGDATCLNFNCQHNYHHCWFTEYWGCAEDGQFTGYIGPQCQIFLNRFGPNIYGSLAYGIGGAQSSVSHPGYLIYSNTFNLSGSQKSIALAGAKNISIIGNTIDGGEIGIGTVGNQGDMGNTNILIAWDTTINSQVGFGIHGGGVNRTDNLRAVSNNFTASSFSAYAGSGDGSYSTSVSLSNNIGTTRTWSGGGSGNQYFLDDLSNIFPPMTDNDTLTSNSVHYYDGAKHVLNPASDSAIFYLDDISPERFPIGAILLITNSESHSCTLRLSTQYPLGSVSMSPGQTLTNYWRTLAWFQSPYAQPTNSYIFIQTLNTGTLNVRP